MNNDKSQKLETAIFGGGCFWCLEPALAHIKGVVSVVPGYAGGDKENPTYEEVCTGKTGHAEAVKIEFNPKIISYEELLHIFFSLHDPTTLNRQGHDVGPQYRSIILYADEKQLRIIQRVIEELSREKIFADLVVTEIKPLKIFWEAEEYHHNYFAKNPEKAYCQLVIAPKMAKFRQKFSQYYN